MESKLYEVSEYKKIVEDLLNGKVVGFPTETVYGLAIIYNDKSSFDKLYEIKNTWLVIEMLLNKLLM